MVSKYSWLVCTNALFHQCCQCRYTLMYTYPYAYYMEDSRKKLVSCFLMRPLHKPTFISVRLLNSDVPSSIILLLKFEYQQAQLEVEIENLSWKLERDDSYCHGVSLSTLIVAVVPHIIIA